MALRAFLRVRRDGGQGGAGPEFVLLAKGSPVLIALGIAGGCYAGWNIASSRVDADARSAAELCETPAVWNLDADQCARMLPECRKQAWAAPIHDHNQADVTRIHRDLSARVDTLNDLDARKPYLRALEQLTSNFEVADFNRATIVCLTAQKK